MAITYTLARPGRFQLARLLLLSSLLLSNLGYSADLTIPTWQVSPSDKPGNFVADAVVEAVRDAKISSQVAGRITRIAVVAGDKVNAGTALLSIDSAVVNQQLAATQAQLAQTQAQASVARNEFERSQQLFKKNYLSLSALDQSKAQLQAADAQVKALQAQVASMQAQTALHALKAPFNGLVSQVSVSVGDSANPGQALLTVYDPTALRLSAQIPESIAPRLLSDIAPGLSLNPAAMSSLGSAAAALRLQVLPAVDPQSRTVTIRVALPAGISNLKPGQAGKLSLALAPETNSTTGALPRSAAAVGQIWIPQAAVVQRAELAGVYVQTGAHSFRLRQLRLGKTQGAQVQVLSGLLGTEKIALDPLLAARSQP